MKITARAEYASLSILELALHYQSGHVQAREIAEKRQIPLKFLEQILIQLRNAGLVKSVRGASGGYLLARPPEKITLKEVVEAVEGELNIVDAKLDDRTLLAVWQEIQDAFLARLDSITVQNLVTRKLQENRVMDFQI
ncbi:MAG: Rrf2 family transcriptional regulator [Acidobacteriota bacterium]